MVVRPQARLTFVAAAIRQRRRMEGVDVDNLYALVIERVERPLIELTLRKTKGNQIRAAQILGINRNTLRKKITDLRIELKKESS